MSEIVFVRHRKTKGVLNPNVYDVIYQTNRCRTFFDPCPKTVKRFMEQATNITERDDELWGHEVIYWG